MTEKNFTNLGIVTALNALNGPEGRAIGGKALPARIPLAKNRTAGELAAAYAAYRRALEELCAPWGVQPEEVGQCDNEELKASAVALLNAPVSVRVYTFPAELLDLCGTGRFDALTAAEVDMLAFLAEEAE